MSEKEEQELVEILDIEEDWDEYVDQQLEHARIHPDHFNLEQED